MFQKDKKKTSVKLDKLVVKKFLVVRNFDDVISPDVTTNHHVLHYFINVNKCSQVVKGFTFGQVPLTRK